jgi:MFS family permease
MRVTCIAALVALTTAFTPTPRVTAPKMRTRLRAGATDLTPTQRTALLGSLIGVYTSNQWCRQLLFSTVDFTSDDAFRFLNVGLELSRADYALLSTLTFNALFAACSLAAGALVDRADAVKLTYVSCGLWALATVATAYTSSFAGVAACRALQGVAMAATAPAGYALLGRAFPPDKLATASSRYAAAVSAGGALAAVSTRLDDAVGWRGAFAVAGASSLVVAVLAFLLLPAEIGPPVPQTKNTEEGGFGGVFASKAAVALLAATAVRFAAGFTIGVWAIPCLRASFAGNDVGSGYALVVGVFGFVSALLGGAAADGLAARASPSRAAAARALVPAAGSLVAAPLWVLALQAPSYGIAIALLAAEFLVAECWIGPTTALLQQAVPAASRGAAQGCFTALTLVGGLAPLAVGAAVDRSNGSLELVPAVAAAVAAAYVVSSLLFLVAAGLLDDDGAAGKES